jgi:hypothetical protein
MKNYLRAPRDKDKKVGGCQLGESSFTYTLDMCGLWGKMAVSS